MAPLPSTAQLLAKHRIIGEQCIGCGVCETMCPNDAIRHTAGKEDYHVVAEECQNCGICIIYCPSDGIVPPDM